MQACATSPSTHRLADPVLDEATGCSIEYGQLKNGPTKIIWAKAIANELGRLAQVVSDRRPVGTTF